VVKNLFKHRKTRYRGLAKNMAQLLTLFGMANLLLARKRLIAIHGPRCVLNRENGDAISKKPTSPIEITRLRNLFWIKHALVERSFKHGNTSAVP